MGRLRKSLGAACRMADEHGDVEVLAADSAGDDQIARMLADEFPAVIHVKAFGLGYDEAKWMAAEAAQGRYVLFLDGDCLPAPGWLEAHLNVLGRDGVVATGGFTRYETGFAASIETVMDFGFLLPRSERILGCYAFNNAGFERETMLATRLPEGDLRCKCYIHAQVLRRRSTPVHMVPAAAVDHERQPFFRERHRQGYDIVAACWTEPALPQAGWLRYGMLAAPVLYLRTVALDWQRLAVGRRHLDMKAWQVPVAAPLLALSRLVDLAGMVKAVRRSPTRSA